MAQQLKQALKKHPFAIALALVAFVFGIALAAVPSKNFEIKLSRTCDSKLPIAQLALELEDPKLWPQWVRALNEPPLIPSRLQAGQLIDLRINAKKGFEKTFVLKMKVSEWIPGRKLVLTLIEDSTGRFNRILNDLTWSIEIGDQQKVTGQVSAQTKSWRSRFLGTYAKTVLLNQVYYFDLLKFTGTVSAEPLPYLPPRTG